MPLINTRLLLYSINVYSEIHLEFIKKKIVEPKWIIRLLFLDPVGFEMSNGSCKFRCDVNIYLIICSVPVSVTLAIYCYI